MTDNQTYNLNQSASERIESEALAWIAQLSGDELTEKDLAAFREWIGRSPAHEAEIRAVAQLWGEMNVLTELRAPIAEADRLAKSLRRQDSRRKKRGYRIAAVAACICIAGGLTWGAMSPKPLAPDAPVQTAALNMPVVFKSAIGEQQVHSLPDGSVITLNTDSYIDVDYTDQQRTVRLLKGEALFTVAKDASRPFIVVADHGVVRAVGTEFSVRLLSQSVDVVVSEGSVELATLNPILPNATPDILNLNDVTQVESLGIITAGQTASIAESKAKVELYALAEIDTKLAWKSGRLEFLGKPLEHVVTEIGRYTDLQIIIDHPELQKLSFGGAFMVGDTDLLFRTLESQYGISAIFSEDKKSVRLIQQ